MSNSAVDIVLAKIGCCLRIENAPDAVQALIQVIPGWPVSVQPAAGARPDIYIYRDVEGLWQSWRNDPTEFDLPSAAAAACSLVGELIGRRLDAEPSLLGVHCGSVEINGTLVLFPESSKAGKSTLTVAFAAAGYRVFGDDVLGLTADGVGVAMGVAPRLRMPMPDSFSTEFFDYAQRHAGPEDECYRFVIPAQNALARLDDNSPVGAIVLLERDAQIVEPEVVKLAPGEGLLQLLCQNFATSDTSNEMLFERLLPLMQRVPCLLLRYSEPLAAARYLAKVIDNSDLQNMSGASLLSHAPVSVANVTPCNLADVWSAASDVSVYTLGDELFLIHTASGAIHRLNASAKLAWQLLQHEPVSGHALSDIIAAYFNVPLAEVSPDIARLLMALSQTGLVIKQQSVVIRYE